MGTRGGLSVALWALCTWCCVAAGGCSSRSAPSDEDLLDKLVHDITGPVDDALVSRALGYVDFVQLPLDVVVPQLSGVYDAAHSQELVSAFKSGMRQRFYGDEFGVRSKKIKITGNEAELTLVLTTRYGPMRVNLAASKLARGWTVGRAQVEP